MFCRYYKSPHRYTTQMYSKSATNQDQFDKKSLVEQIITKMTYVAFAMTVQYLVITKLIKLFTLKMACLKKK